MSDTFDLIITTGRHMFTHIHKDIHIHIYQYQGTPATRPGFKTWGRGYGALSTELLTDCHHYSIIDVSFR